MQETNNAANKTGPSGIGGWLILVAIAIVFSFVLELFSLNEMLGLYKDGSYQALSDPNSSFYIPYAAMLINIETLMGVAHMVLLVFIGYLFLNKKAAFPKWYIIVMVLRPLWVLIDTLAVNAVMPEIVEVLNLNEQNIKQMIRAVIPLCIWGPYMKMSVRVKNTFVH